MSEKRDLEIIDVRPYKEISGKIKLIIFLIDSVTNHKFQVDFPYIPDYSLKLDGPISAFIEGDTFKFASDIESEFNSDKELGCPFCKSQLQHPYDPLDTSWCCFNAECSNNSILGIMDIFDSFDTSITHESANLILNMFNNHLLPKVSIVSILEELEQRRFVWENCLVLYNQVCRMIHECTPSQFLKMLKAYDTEETLSRIDDTFTDLESMLNAFNNIDEHIGKLNDSDASKVKFIVSILNINQIFILKFRECRNTIFSNFL